MQKTKTHVLTEAAVMVALAQILSYVVIYKLPNGGSVDLAMLPIIIFAFRNGLSWGTGVGFVYGILQYVLGNGIAIDWTTMIADYMVAYTLLGFGAGLARKVNVYASVLCGAVLRFMAHFVVGAVVWGKYMPEVFLGMPMTNEWVYSALYNMTYMVPCTIAVFVVVALLKKPMAKYFVVQ